MNLRTKKRSVQRRSHKKKEMSLLAYAVIYTLVIGCLFTSVFGATLYFDGKSEKLNKGIAVLDSNSYRLQREIQNLKIKLETYSRKEFIDSKIRKHDLGLNTPCPLQVVYLDSVGYDEYNRSHAPELAYDE